MSFFIRVWEDQTQELGYFDITPDLILGMDIDDNKASNDDPFEIVGRQAKITAHKNAITEQMLTLVPIEIPVTTNVNASDVKYCIDYYANLIQILDEYTYSAVFTGLVMRQSVGYDLGSEQISFTISDTLYIWITIAKQMIDNEPTTLQPPTYLTHLTRHPTWGLGSPLKAVSIDYSVILPYILIDYPLTLPDYKDKTASSWYLGRVLDPSDDEYDWCRLAQYGCIFETDDFPERIVISYFVIFRTRFTNYTYRVYYYRVMYDKATLCFVQPYSYAFGRLEESDGTYDFTYMPTLDSTLKANYVISNGANFGWQTVTAVWGENAQNTLPNQAAPRWTTDFKQYYEHGDGQTLTVNLPYYGQTTATMNIVPAKVMIKPPNTIASLTKAFCTLFGLGVRALADGGIEFFPHLIKTLGTGTPLTISDSDVINFTASGTYTDIDKALSPMESQFEFGDIMVDVYDYYYRNFFQNITATYSLTIPRTYLDSNTFTPFMPISVYGITLYLNKWSDALYNDTINLECFGRLI